jgi:hypothetical protein
MIRNKMFPTTSSELPRPKQLIAPGYELQIGTACRQRATDLMAAARRWIPSLTVRTPDGTRPIMLESTYYSPANFAPAPLAIIAHGSYAGHGMISHLTEAHWLHANGFAVLALMRRGRGRSEGINGEEDFGRDHNGTLSICRRGSHRPTRISNPRLPTTANCPTYGRDLCCSPANRAVGFSLRTMRVSARRKLWAW